MQGQLSIALTRRADGNLFPAITAKYPKSTLPGAIEDPRDELIRAFEDELEDLSNWARIEPNHPELSPYKSFKVIPIRGSELKTLLHEVQDRLDNGSGKEKTYHSTFGVGQSVSVSKNLGGGNYTSTVLRIHDTQQPVLYDLVCQFKDKNNGGEFIIRVPDWLVYGVE